MTSLPPDNQPDAIWIGPVGPIPVHYDDDPRLAEEREAWSSAMFKAQALHSPDDLLTGLVDEDWRVRHQVVDRLIGRARTDVRTLPALLDRLACDSAWQVRDAVAMAISSFKNDGRVVLALRAAVGDESDEVRWSAAHSLRQLGEPPEIRPES